ncbi:MAG TPA: alanine racemase, partial [Anaerolineae bacterium]
MKTVAAKGKTNRTRQPKNKREKSVVAPLRPAWVEIDLAAIESNARRLKEIIGAQTELMAMVKANGYGHGAVESARAALRGGATWLGVYAVGEGVELRLAGLDAPIIVLGHTFPEWAEAAVKHDLKLTVFSRDTVEAIQQAAHAQRKHA